MPAPASATPTESRRDVGGVSVKTRLWLLPRLGLTRHVAWNLRRPAAVLAGTGVMQVRVFVPLLFATERLPPEFVLLLTLWFLVAFRYLFMGYRVDGETLRVWTPLLFREIDLDGSWATASRGDSPWAPLCVRTPNGREVVLRSIPWRDRWELFEPTQILEPTGPSRRWPSRGRRWGGSDLDFHPQGGEHAKAPSGRWALPLALTVVGIAAIAGLSYFAWPWHAADYADAAITGEAHRELAAAMTAIAAAQRSDGATVSGERVLACLDGAGGTFRVVNTHSDEFALAAGRVLESRGWTAVAPAEWVKLVYTSTDAVGLRVGRLPGARFIDPRISAALGETDDDGWIGTALGQPCENKMVWPWQA